MSKRYRVVRTSPPAGSQRVIAYFQLDAAWRAAEQYARFDKRPVGVEDTSTGTVVARFLWDHERRDIVMETP